MGFFLSTGVGNRKKSATFAIKLVSSEDSDSYSRGFQASSNVWVAIDPTMVITDQDTAFEKSCAQCSP